MMTNNNYKLIIKFNLKKIICIVLYINLKYKNKNKCKPRKANHKGALSMP